MSTRMQTSLKVFATLAFAATFAGAALVAEAAEKKQMSYVKTNYRTGYKTAQAIGDVPNHEVAQELSTADMKYSDPSFKVRSEWAYVHTDSIDGAGIQTGYYIDTHEDGNQTYGTFKGTVKVTSKPDGAWEATWEGTYQYVGGTGRYKNIKGHGRYKGGMSSQDPSGSEEGQETVEY